jgi:hypothetical protein
MSADANRLAMRGFGDYRLPSANGGDRPVLEVDQVTKIYPSEPPMSPPATSTKPPGRPSWRFSRSSITWG